MMLQEYTSQAVMTMLNKYNDILTVDELCEVLNIGKNTAYKLLKNGDIKSIKIGRIYRIPKKSIKEYINQLQ